MKEPKINVAHYTKLLNDCEFALSNISDLFSENFTDYLENDDTLDVPNFSLYDVFIGKYRYYEINELDKDNPVSDQLTFIKSVTDTFYQHVNYYLELAKSYYKKFDFTTANKRRVHREDSGTTQVNTSTESEGKTENDTYGLPNKKVDNLKDGYLTNVEKGTSRDAADSTREGSSSLASDVVTTYDNEYLDLKRQYVRQMRNLLLEFVDKFEDCFLHVYS